ncbi:condensation domain-containing protein [Streptomyces sp. NPDC007901]|uniref:condensation domain-containing protein n=1 Tax=Streptomyces sp. NPDC007901 TaxID=3364785 RepID=UPI0036EA2A81
MQSDADRITAVLCEILSGRLEGQQIGPDDDFYAMGGDSLTALLVVADAGERGVSLQLRDLLYHPTARALAAHLAGPADEPAGPVPSAVRLTPADLSLLPAGVSEALPASALQIAMVYLCESSEDPELYHSVMDWEVAGAFDEPRFRWALTGLCDRHPALRSSFDLGTYAVPAQLFWSSVEPPLVLGAPAERPNSLDWGAAPLFRCHVDVLDGAFRVTLAVHHALVDGWSLGRLIVDLLSLYQGEPLPARPDGVERAFIEAEFAQSSIPEAAEFWARQTAPSLLFPERGRFSGAADARDAVGFPLPAALVRDLTAAAKRLRVPLKSLVLAAHARSFAELTGRTEVVTGLVMNTRPELPGADRVAGLYLNTLPVLVRARGGWEELATAGLVAERSGSRYRAYPLAHLENRLGRPAFDAVLNVTNFRVYRELDRLTGPKTGAWRLRGKPSFPFRVDVELDGIAGGDRVVVAFDPDLVPPSTARRYADLFERALTEAVDA